MKNIVFLGKTTKINRRNFTGVAVDPTGITFYRDGLRHREDGPAAILNNGDQFWYRDNTLHREDGPAEERFSQRYSCWYCNGLVHRDDGPAIIFGLESKSTQQEYFRYGLRHREDGPAVDAKNTKKYFIGGVEYTKKKFKRLKKEALGLNSANTKLKNIV